MAMAAEHALLETSRTFFIPTMRLPDVLREAVTSAYLCMRAIDEIEDHPTLERREKEQLLRAIGDALALGPRHAAFAEVSLQLAEHRGLPDVTRRLGEWAAFAPPEVAPRITDAAAAMSDRMAKWVASGWTIGDPRALERYTYDVAGAVGVLLSDLWSWFDGTRSDRRLAVEFGQGLQLVNIASNRREDLARGIDLLPPGWALSDVVALAREHLRAAGAYVEALPPGPAFEFCRIPLTLALATLEEMSAGREKLSRAAVGAIVGSLSPRE